MATEPTVFIIDDDPGALESLVWLIESIDLKAMPFQSAQEFLDVYNPTVPGCLVLDIRMPGMTGLELQERLTQLKSLLPIIIVTGHGNVPLCSQALKAGAYEFLEKPVDDKVLLDRIKKALAFNAERRERQAARRQITRRLERVSPREREVLELLVDGYQIKQIAVRLQISPQTAAKHRTRVLDKLRIRSDVELVKLILEYRAEDRATTVLAH